MKASGSGYGVSGSGEYGTTDYREQRKNTALGAGLIIAIIAAIGVVAWYLLSKVSDIVPKVPDVGQMWQGAKETTVSHAIYPIPAEQAINDRGEYYPVTTQDGLMKRLDAMNPTLQALVVTGDKLTGGAAVQAGANAAITVNRLGLNDAYTGLDPISKTFVSVGEGVGNLFGVSPITMGHDMRSDIISAAGVTKTVINPDTGQMMSEEEYNRYIGM